MAFTFHIPRKKEGSSEPRLTISKRIISLNPACIEKHFKDKSYVKIGYDIENKKMIFIPAAKKNEGLKIVKNDKWDARYINAGRLLDKLTFKDELQGEYRCIWNEDNNGIVIDIKTDKIK